MKKGMGMKKLLAIALAILMTASCCPVSVLAEETAETSAQTEAAEMEETAIEEEAAMEEEPAHEEEQQELPATEEEKQETLTEKAAEEQTAISTEPVTAQETAPTLQADRTVIQSGSCGTNVTYTLYSDGELVISGKGAMRGGILRCHGIATAAASKR